MPVPPKPSGKAKSAKPRPRVPVKQGTHHGKKVPVAKVRTRPVRREPKPESPGMKAKVMDLTPELAASYLETNTNNRKIRVSRVATLARVIARNEWVENGEAIKFDTDGYLLDGQHRLEAIIMAAKEIRTLVVTGLHPQSQVSMDQGAGRTFADTLTWLGESNTTDLASTIRVLKHFYSIGRVTTQNHSASYTKEELLQFLEDHPGIRDALSPPESKMNRSLLTPSVSASIYYILSDIDTDNADDFFYKLGSGDGLVKGDPIFALRYVLEQNLLRRHGKINTQHRSALTFKAWNAYCRGEEVQTIKWRAGGARRESYPVVEGMDYDTIEAYKEIAEADSTDTDGES